MENVIVTASTDSLTVLEVPSEKDVQINLLEDNIIVAEIGAEKSMVVEVNHGAAGPIGLTGMTGGVGPQGPEGKVGPQGEQGLPGSFAIHNQSIPSEVWVVQHTLNKYPSVSVTDSTGRQVYGCVDYNSPSKLEITFTAAFSGIAYLN